MEVPDENLLGYHHPKRVPHPPTADELIARALADPIGAPRLAKAVRPAGRVLILVDDLTRPTPQHLLLPPILEELRLGGVRDEDVSLLIAYGSHRRMTLKEREERFGSEIVGRYQILDHDWRNRDLLLDLGRLEDGCPVVVNRHLVESDFVLSVGRIVPHRSLGFTGGSKMVLPGVAGKASLDYMHWQDAQYATDAILGRLDNPIRRMADAFAVRAGLKYVVNVVLDDEFRLVGIYAGDPEAAFKQGCGNRWRSTASRSPSPPIFASLTPIRPTWISGRPTRRSLPWSLPLGKGEW